MHSDPQHPSHSDFEENAEMDGRAHERLREARIKAGYGTATDAAKAFGWKVSTYLSHENSSRGLSATAARRYARAYRISLAWLFTGEGDNNPTVPLVGYVGAGAQILPVDDHAKGTGLEDAEAPPVYDPDMVAVRVRGDSMYPAHHEGDLIYYTEHAANIESVIGKECIVHLADGRTFIKVLERGSQPDVFNLVSYNAPPMRDQVVEWVARIRWILRA